MQLLLRVGPSSPATSAFCWVPTPANRLLSRQILANADQLRALSPLAGHLASFKPQTIAEAALATADRAEN